MGRVGEDTRSVGVREDARARGSEECSEGEEYGWGTVTGMILWPGECIIGEAEGRSR